MFVMFAEAVLSDRYELAIENKLMILKIRIMVVMMVMLILE